MTGSRSKPSAPVKSPIVAANAAQKQASVSSRVNWEHFAPYHLLISPILGMIFRRTAAQRPKIVGLPRLKLAAQKHRQ
jgi:hypothetical protein